MDFPRHLNHMLRKFRNNVQEWCSVQLLDALSVCFFYGIHYRTLR